ncbi:MAG TPA: ATP-binding protein [Candidatus Saccharimonadales bacterium]|nr:ATP-binding protein [Candidatus Saccharimonadales bacterium]
MTDQTLYLMLGYPGAGKTTISKYIHELTGAVHLWADHERNKRFPNPTRNHEENIQLYAQLNKETRQLLHQGKSVIFDTNFNFYKDRKKMRVWAAKEGVRTVVIWVATSKDLARKRATLHSHGQHTRVWGNMPVERFERIARNLEPPRPGEQVIILDGTNSAKEDVARALEQL